MRGYTIQYEENERAYIYACQALTGQGAIKELRSAYPKARVLCLMRMRNALKSRQFDKQDETC